VISWHSGESLFTAKDTKVILESVGDFGSGQVRETYSFLVTKQVCGYFCECTRNITIMYSVYSVRQLSVIAQCVII